MRGFAYAILIIVLLSIVMEPFQEMMIIFVEKAKVDSAVKNAGRLSIERSVEDFNRSDKNAEIEIDHLMQDFNTSFSTALNLNYVETMGHTSYFTSVDGHYNNFSINFDKTAPNICKVTVSSKYRYKTRYLKFAEISDPDLLSFDLKLEEPFIIDIVN